MHLAPFVAILETPARRSSSDNRPSLSFPFAWHLTGLPYFYAFNVSVPQCHSLSTIPVCFSLSGSPLILSQIRRLCFASPQTPGLSPQQQNWTASTSSGTISLSLPHKEVITGLHLSHTALKSSTMGLLLYQNTNEVNLFYILFFLFCLNGKQQF